MAIGAPSWAEAGAAIAAKSPRTKNETVRFMWGSFLVVKPDYSGGAHSNIPPPRAQSSANMDVIPSIYATRAVGHQEDCNPAFENGVLRMGDVTELIRPEDPRSLTHQFNEYNVLVQHRENGTAVTKLYEHCLLVNSMAGLADKTVWTLRPSPQQGLKNANNALSIAIGSKVVLLCINSDFAAPLILGGLRDERDTDVGTKPLGHHFDFVFNGVQFHINDDGSWECVYAGKTQTDGTVDPTVDLKSVGTTVAVTADGTFSVKTKDAAQSITVNHADGTVTISGQKDVTIRADKIHLGDAADEHAVLGDTAVKLLGQLLDLIVAQTHPTAVGPSGPPLNAPAFRLLKQQLGEMLSEFTFVKKNP